VAIDRRTFISGVAVLPAVASPGMGAMVARTVPMPRSEGGLADLVDNMAQLRLVLAAQDNMLDPGSVAPTAVLEIDILKRLSRAATGSARDNLMSLQATYAEFAGWLSDDLGDRKVGEYWTDRALEWAHEADNELIVVYVLMRKAQRAVEANDPAATISLAQAAQRRGAITPRVRASAAQFEAQGHALRHDHGAFRDAIDRAGGLVVAAPAATTGDWAPWCTPGYVDVYEAAGWMRLGEPVRAATVYEKALNDWSVEFQRDEGIHAGRLARAHAASATHLDRQAGDHPEQAAEYGRAALRVADRDWVGAHHRGVAPVASIFQRVAPGFLGARLPGRT
jgi:hypothetical protein